MFPLLMALLGTSADAQVFDAPGVLQVLALDDVMGDGATPVMVHAVVLNEAGHGVAGLEVTPKVWGGEIETCSEVGGGVYGCAWTPPKVTEPGTVRFQLRTRTPEKKTLKTEVQLSVLPKLTGALSISTDPQVVTLGETESVTLTILLQGEVSPPDVSELAIEVSAGTLTDLAHMGSGRFIAKYQPPKSSLRQAALITVSDRRDPARIYGATALPLVAQRDQSVKTTPNSSVLLKIDGRQFGPVQSDRSGRARVPVQLPPGPTTATLVTVTDGKPEESTIELDDKPTRRLQWIPGLTGVPADDALSIPMRVAVFRADGQPDSQAQLALSSEQGEFSAPQHEGDGLYAFTFTPAVTNEARLLTLTASLEGSEVDRHTRQVNLIPIRPAKLTLSAEPTPLPSDASSLAVSAQIVGPSDVLLTDRDLILRPTGAKLSGEIQEQRDGTYSVELAVTGRGPVEIWATAPSPSTGNPLHQLVAFTTQKSLQPDGVSGSMITLIAVDAFGYPVPKVPIELAVTRGGGSLPASATTDANGMAQVFYTAGRAPHVVEIVATARDSSAALNLLQLPADAGTISLPLSGDKMRIRQIQDWQSVVAGLQIPRK